MSTSLLDYTLLPNTHKLIHSQGIWTARQMFCNGNHFYLDFFPLGIWRNVRCSDLSSEMGTWMKVLLKKSNFDTQLSGDERPTSLLSLSSNSFKLSEHIQRGIRRVGYTASLDQGSLSLRLPGATWKHHIRATWICLSAACF